MIVTITGTPGAGKTYISRKLTNFDYIDLNRIIKEERLYDSYDRKDKTYDVDVKKLKKLWKRFGKYKEKPLKVKAKMTLIELKQSLKKHAGIIIDSHLSHHMPSDLCIVVKSDIKTIAKRLKKRGYAEKKIRDNIESEIFDVCLEEARDLGRNIVVIGNG